MTTNSGQSSRWIGTGAGAAAAGAADTGKGRGCRFDSSASIRFTATRVSPRALDSV